MAALGGLGLRVLKVVVWSGALVAGSWISPWRAPATELAAPTKHPADLLTSDLAEPPEVPVRHPLAPTAASRAAASRPPSAPAAARPSAARPARRRPADPWTALARCESSGNPRAVGGDGRYFGAFQFTLASWESVGMSGNPIDHPYAVQLHAARRLADQWGWSPWPVCARVLGLLGDS